MDVEELSFTKKNAPERPVINYYNEFFIYGRKKRHYLERVLNLLIGDRAAKPLMNSLQEINMVKAKKPLLSNRNRKQLCEIFKPGIMKLSELLERDLKIWQKGGI